MSNLINSLSHRLCQSRHLLLTPSMRLKLKFWQMNIQELSQAIEQEFIVNPLLELVDYVREESISNPIEEKSTYEVSCKDVGVLKGGSTYRFNFVYD